MKSLLFAPLVVLLIACGSSPVLTVRPNTKVDTLKVYFDPGPEVNRFVSDQFSRSINNFIFKHNAQPNHHFKLVRVQTNPDSSSFIIRLVASRLVTPQEQTAGALVSLAGLSLPIVMVSAGAPLVIFFYYFPHAKSQLEYSLTPDINGSSSAPTNYVLSSPGFLQSYEKQVFKHGIYMEKFLTVAVGKIEASQRKLTRR